MKPKFGRADMSSLMHSRECAKAIGLSVSSFVADFVGLKMWFQALEFSVSCKVAIFISAVEREGETQRQEELLLYILTRTHRCRNYAPLFSRCSFQEYRQSTIPRPAHYVLSVWASGEKTDFLGMLLLAPARARGPNCVQQIVSSFCCPPSRSTAEITILGYCTRNRKLKRLGP